MRLIIHMGTQKTGSSAIQKFCMVNQQKLENVGILYPEWLVTEANNPAKPDSQKGHCVFKRLLINKPDILIESCLEYLSMKAKEKKCQTIIISDEEFLVDVKIFNQESADLLKSYFSQIDMIVYFRNPYDFLWSLYKERLTWPQQIQDTSLKSFLSWARHRYFPYESYLAPALQAFGTNSITVFNYDTARSDIVVHFIKAIDPSLDVSNWAFGSTRINLSLPDQWIEQYRYLLRKGICSHNKPSFNNDFLRYIDYYNFSKNKKSFMYCPEEMELFQDWELSAARISYRYGCYINTNKPNSYVCLNKWSQTQRWLSVQDQQSLLDRHIPTQLQPQINDGSWGLSVMHHGNIDIISIFLEYHLTLCPKILLLYLDELAPSIIKKLRQKFKNFENLKIIDCNSDFWIRHGEPKELDQKLEVVHLDARAQFLEYNCAWGLNIDGDELLYLNSEQSVDCVLKNMSSRFSAVRIWPYESLGQASTKPFSTNHFKRNFGSISNIQEMSNGLLRRIRRFLPQNRLLHLHRFVFSTSNYLSDLILGGACLFSAGRFRQLSWFPAAAQFYEHEKGELAGLFRKGFLGHKEGRTILSMDVRVDKFNSHQMVSRTQSLVYNNVQNELVILHFDCGDFANWKEKWDRRLDGRTVSKKMALERMSQLYVYEQYKQAGQLEKLYDMLHNFSSTALRRAIKKGICIEAHPLNRIRR